MTTPEKDRPPDERPRLLFVCVQNSCRSQMAEAFARIYGGDAVEPYSAGSRPSGAVNPTAIEVMREVGYDLEAHRSTSVEELPAERFSTLVSMGCGDECPTVVAERRLEWDIADPKELPLAEFRRVRDEIELHVRALLSRELGAGR